MDSYFTDEKIEQLVTCHNWEMVRADDGKYKLRQIDRHYMTTVDFVASDETAEKYLTESDDVKG